MHRRNTLCKDEKITFVHRALSYLSSILTCSWFSLNLALLHNPAIRDKALHVGDGSCSVINSIIMWLCAINSNILDSLFWCVKGCTGLGQCWLRVLRHRTTCELCDKWGRRWFYEKLTNCHSVLCKSPRLVGADDWSAAEGLNSLQILHETVLSFHSSCSKSQTHLKK